MEKDGVHGQGKGNGKGHWNGEWKLKGGVELNCKEGKGNGNGYGEENGKRKRVTRTRRGMQKRKM